MEIEIKKKLKMEALKRMKALELHDEGVCTCVGDFRANDNVWKSEFYGILYWLDDDESQAVKEIEEEYSRHNLKVYHCYKAHTSFGEILYMFYVTSDSEDTYQNFIDNLKSNIIDCYAYNMTTKEFSEFGSCYIKSMFGGVQVY